MYLPTIRSDFVELLKKIIQNSYEVLRHFCAKHFTSIFTDKKGYGLSQYDVEVCTKEDEMMCRVRQEEYEM